MTQLVRFTVRDGGSVVVEVEESHRQTGPVGGRPNLVRDLGEAFERKLGDVRDAAVAALDTFRTAGSPDEIKVTFGVKLTTEAGAIIARTAMEGNLNVELVWHRERAGGTSRGRTPQ